MNAARSQLQPACATEPERWFDKSDTMHALRHCLACPMRQWCAAEAVRVKASFGMWAGIFISHNPAEVAPQLLAIARMADAPVSEASQLPAAEAPKRPLAAIPTTPGRQNTVLRTVAARSSGHCEIMTRDCRLTFDTLGSRVADQDPWTAHRASDVYAVCRPCAAAIDNAEPHFVKRLGYIVAAPYEPAYTRFLWRQAHWVYLDGGNRICPARDADNVRAAL